MNKFKSTVIVFLMLSSFCGQVLAMSFLDCCEDMDQTSATMEMNHHDHASMHSNNNSISDSADCEHQCDFCLGVTSLLLEQSASYAPQLALSSSTLDYQFLLLSSRSDNPYRPPIFS